MQRHIDVLRESELAALEALLELPDNELADWLTGRLPIPAEADTPMLRRVRDEALPDGTVHGRAWPGLHVPPGWSGKTWWPGKPAQTLPRSAAR